MRNPNRVVGLSVAVLLSLGLFSWFYQERLCRVEPRAIQALNHLGSLSKARALPPSESRSAPIEVAVSSSIRPSSSAVDSFREWATRFAASDAALRPTLIQEGVQLAKARRFEMESLMDGHALQFLAATLPYSLQRILPDAVSAWVEQPISGQAQVERTLMLGATEVERDTVEYSAELNHDLSRAFFAHPPFLLPPGHAQPVNGARLGQNVVLSGDPVRVLTSEEVSDLKAVGKLPLSAMDACWADLGGVLIPLARPEDAPAVSSIVRSTVRAGIQLADLQPGSTNLPPEPVTNLNQRTISVLFSRVRFFDDPEISMSEDDITRMADDLRELMRVWSYNTLHLVPILTPVFTLPHDRQWYNDLATPQVLLRDARSAAAQGGYDYRNYDIDFVSHPYIGIYKPFVSYTLAGRGTLYFTNQLRPLIAALGFNMGISYGNAADTRRPGPVPTDPPVTLITPESDYGHEAVAANTLFDALTAARIFDVRYGDPFDAMGLGLLTNGPSAITAQFNSLSKYELGWLPPSHVEFRSENITNRLYAFDTDRLTGDRKYAIALRKDALRDYWLEHRQRFTRGGDTNQPGGKPVPYLQHGVLLYTTPWAGTEGSSQLIDTTPGTSEGFEDSALLVGRTFADREANLFITPVAQGNESGEEWIDVVVRRGPFPGNHPPTFQLSASSLLLTQGQEVVFTANQVVDPDGDGVAFHWDFSDGSFELNQSVAAKRFSAGDWTARCEVSDMKGGKTIRHILVHVGGPSDRSYFTGQIVDLEGNPVPDVRVAAVQSVVTNAPRVAFTDSDGRYTITGVDANAQNMVPFLYGYHIDPLNFSGPNPLESTAGGEFDFLARALPRVSVASLADVTEENTNTKAIFRFTRTGDMSADQLVRFQVSGTATSGKDFSGLTNTFITIPAGTNSVDLPLSMLDDTVSEGKETLTLSLAMLTSLTNFSLSITNDGTNDLIVISTNAVAYPGWSLAGNPAQPAWSQIDPPYVFGQAEATLGITDHDGVAHPTVMLLAFDDVAVEDGSDEASLIVSRVGSTLGDLVVNYSVGGTASNGVDYLALSGSIVIPDGRSGVLLNLRAVPDHLVEGTETVLISLLGSTNYDSTNSPLTLLILDDDLPSVTVTATQSTVSEKTSVPGRWVIARAGDLSADLQVNYLLAGTATNVVDFQALSGWVIIPAGAATAEVLLNPIRDLLVEGTETVDLQISSSPTYNIGTPSHAVVSILDDQTAKISLRVVTAAAAEGGTVGVIEFVRTGSTSGPVTLNIELGGTADNGSDYSAVGNRVLFPAGATNVQLRITPIDDRAVEILESVVVRLLPGEGYQIDGQSLGSVTIADNDAGSLPSLSFELLSTTAREGSAEVDIAVELSGPPSLDRAPVLAEYHVIGGTATWSNDYRFLDTNFFSLTDTNPFVKTGYLYFQYVTNTTTISLRTNIRVTIPQDLLSEPTETVLLQLVYPQIVLSNLVPVTNLVTVTNAGVVTNGTLVSTQTQYTIFPANYVLGSRQFHTLYIDDDDSSLVSVTAKNPYAYEEGRVAGIFSISRGTNNTGKDQRVHYQVTGTATPLVDYQALSGWATIPASNLSVDLPIIPVDDETFEGPETVILTLLEGSGYAVSTNQYQAKLILVDNDGAIEFPQPSYQAGEKDGIVQIPVHRVGDLSISQSVAYQIEPGTATPDLDYQAVNGTLTFLPGETLKTIPITVVDDTELEAPETVLITLSSQTGGVPLAGQTQATLTIVSDDSMFVFTTNRFVGSEFSGAIEVTVARIGSVSGAASVRVTTSDAAALAGQDYTTLDRVIPFADGQSTNSVLVTILDDVLMEGDEPFQLTLSEPTGPVTLGVEDSADVVILDDESAIEFTETEFRVNENQGSAVLTVHRLGGVLNAVSVNYRTLDGSAKTPGEYLGSTGTVTFLGTRVIPSTNGLGGTVTVPGTAFVQIVIPLIDDTLGEPTKQFQVVLSNPKIVGTTGRADSVVLGTNSTASVVVLDNESAGGLDTEFGASLSVNGAVNAIAIQPNGRILFAGEFTEVNDFTLRHLARLTPQGDFDVGFNPGLAVDGTVLALLAQADGKILVGGSFTNVGGFLRRGLARLNADGDVDESFDSGFGTLGSVRALAVQEGGSVVLGGNFTDFDGAPRGRLARVDGFGVLDARFAPRFDASVNALIVQPDGKILVGGAFTNLNGARSAGVARLNADGTVDTTFKLSVDIVGVVNALALQPGGAIVVGGAFLSPNGGQTANLLQLNSAGDPDASFELVGSPDAPVRALGVHASGRLYVAGDFTEIGGDSHNRFARLRVDGTLDPSFLAIPGANAAVRAVAVQGNSALLIGGDFTAVNGTPSSHLARIHGEEKLTTAGVEFASSSLTVSEGVGKVTLTVRRTGDSTVPFTVHFSTVPASSSAIAGLDYLATNGVLSFPAGVLSRTFDVSILEDQFAESTESIALTLDGVPPEIDLGGVATSVILIEDNEVSVGFASATYTTSEAAGAVEVTLIRQGAIGGAASVVLSTLDGSATAGLDFIATNTVVNFQATETTKKISIPILQDMLHEGTEDFVVRLSLPSHDLLLSLAETTVRIADDDFERLIVAGIALLADPNGNGTVEPGETVTLGISIRNDGSGGTTNLTATLLATNNIVPSSGSQLYGALAGGGAPISRSFSFGNTALAGTTLKLVLRLQDGDRDLGLLTVSMPVGPQSLMFASKGSIAINDHEAATPYPSTLDVSGLVGPPVRITLTLDGFTHTSPGDVDILLVSPSGEKSVVMSDTGGRFAVSGLVITLDDTAPTALPDRTALTSGTFKPVNYVQNDAFDAPAPAGPYTKSDLKFTGNANGNWSLYVLDDTSADQGSIANGWRLNILTTGQVQPQVDVGVSLTGSIDPVVLGQNLSYTLRVSNSGPGIASGVVVKQALPENATLISASGGGTVVEGIFTATIPSLGVDQSLSYTIVVRPVAVGSLSSSAALSGLQNDIYAPNDVVALTTAVTSVIAPVRLTVASEEGVLILTWPTSGSGILESTSTLTAGPWAKVNSAPVQSGQNWKVTVPMESATQFYRLRSP